MRRISGIAVSLSLLLSPATGAEGDPQPIEPEAVSLGRPVDFTSDVKPIFESNCLACHNAGVEEGSLSLEDVAGMTKGGDRGSSITPGRPDESLLFTVAAHRGEPVMPPADNDVEAEDLTPRELGIIRQWIIEGANPGSGLGGPLISWRPLPVGYRVIHAVALDPEARFAAIGRGNQLEVYDLVLGGPGIRLVDPHLSSLTGDGGPMYPAGAADRDLVQAAAFSPDGTLLATAGYRAVKLWRYAAAGDANPLGLAGVTAVAISNDRTRIAAASANELHLLKADDGLMIATRTVPAAVTAVAFAPDGASILAAGADKVLRRWPAEGGEPAVVAALPSPATTIVAVGDRLATSHDDGAIRVWSSTGAAERELKAHPGPVRSLILLPQTAEAVASCGEDGTLRIWDVASGSEIRSFVHGGPVSGITVSPDGRVIASCGDDGAVRFWNAADGNKLGEFVGRIDSRRSARIARDEAEWRKQLSVVAEGRVKEAEEAIKDRETIATKAIGTKSAAEQALAEARKAKEESATAALAAAEQYGTAPEDAALKTKSEEAAKVAMAAREKLSKAEEDFGSAERSLKLAEEAFAAAKSRLEERQGEKRTADEAAAAAEADAQSAIAEADRPVEAKDIAFSPDSARVSVTYADGTIQTLSADGRPLDSWQSGDGTPARFVFLTPERALRHSADGSLHLTRVNGRWEHTATFGPPDDAPLDLARSLFADRVLALAFSPDGRLLATGGGEPTRSGELILWDVASRSVVRTFVDAHSDTVQSIEFSRDGRVLVTAAADKFAKAFDVESGSFLRSFEGHTDHVLGVSFKADGANVATASADSSVKIWDAVAGEQRRTVTGHTKQVTAVRYVGLSDRIATASGDRTVRLFRANDGGQVRAFDGPTDYVHALAVSRDGAMIAAAGEDGVLYAWDVESGKLSHRIEPPRQEGKATAAR